MLENGDIGKPEKSIVFNRDKKDLSGYLTERVATWWLIVAASGVTLRVERDFGGFFGDGRPLLHFLDFFFFFLVMVGPALYHSAFSLLSHSVRTGPPFSLL